MFKKESMNGDYKYYTWNGDFEARFTAHSFSGWF